MAHNRDEVGDNEHETTSQNCANYPHPFVAAINEVASSSRRHESLARRRWKSDSELLLCGSNCSATNQKINKRMGIRVSRWQSADNVVTENSVYQPLSKVNVLVNRDEAIDSGGEDDYELLESTDDDELEEGGVFNDDDLNCGGNNNDLADNKSNDNNLSAQKTTTAMNSYDGQHANSRCTSTKNNSTNTPLLNHNDNTSTTTVESNANCQSGCVIRKFSTLPRVKSRENITRNESGVRKSYKLSSSRSNEIDVQEMTELVRRNELDGNSLVVVSKRQESDNKNIPFKCTTPARSRFSEGLNRLSVENDQKHSSERSGNNNATGSSGESTSGTGESNNC